MTTPTALDDADPRFDPVINEFSTTPGVSVMQSNSRALRALMLNGKSFSMSSHGRLVLKLNPDRANALIAAGVGVPFAMSPGRVAKGWIDVTAPDADWLALAKEAYQIAASTPAKEPRARAAKTARKPAKKAGTVKRKGKPAKAKMATKRAKRSSSVARKTRL